jgi:capsular polysaccharide transport system permease protein
MIPFLIFNSVSTKVAQSVNFSKPLLAYPSVTWADAIIARFVLNFLTEVLVAYIIFAGLLMLFETRVIIDLPTVALSLFLSGFLALGVGTLNCFLFTQFPVWQRAWGILMRPMFILACVLFLFETIPQPYRDWLWWNPLVHVVALARRGFYPSYDAPYASVVFVCAVSAVLLVIGLVFLSKYHRDLINN